MECLYFVIRMDKLFDIKVMDVDDNNVSIEWIKI